MIAIVKTLRFGAGLLLCVGVAGLLGCKQDAGSAPVRPLPEVGVMTVAAQTIPDDPEFIGQAEASRIVEIRSQVTGIIKNFFFAVPRGCGECQSDGSPGRGAGGPGEAES